MYFVFHQCRLVPILLVVLGVNWTSLRSYSQIPPVAPVAPAADDSPNVTKREPKQTTIAPSGIVDHLVLKAEAEMREGKYDDAASGLETALMHSITEQLPDAAKNDIRLRFSNALYAKKDFTSAVRVLNELIPSKMYPVTCFLRAAAYSETDWKGAMIDELRTGLRLDPTNSDVQRALGEELVLSNIPTLRNAKEALALLLALESKIDEVPRYAKLIAIAASRTGDFELAERMQDRFLHSNAKMDLFAEMQIMKLYQSKKPIPIPALPAIDRSKLLSDGQIEAIARKSMVQINVEQEIELKETVSGRTGTITTFHTHCGTILNSMGQILISSETIRIPQFKELSTPNVAGTARRLKDPIIRVLLMPTDGLKRKFMGNAKIKGIDEATGLAVREIEEEAKFQCVRIEELTPARFVPEYRMFDSNAISTLTKNWDLSIGDTPSETKPKFDDIGATEIQQHVYDTDHGKFPSTSKFLKLNESEGAIGTPLFNQLGECIGIRHQVRWNGRKRSVAIPASICTRVAAKLASYGEVFRMHSPFDVYPVTLKIKIDADKSKEIKGITVYQDPQLPGYEGLDTKTIVSLDGVETPTLTEWLIASERVYALGLETVTVELCDWKSGKKTSMVIPARKPNKPIDLRAKAEYRTTIDSGKAIEQASQWIATNVHVDRKVLDDLIQKFDRALRSHKNVACYFGSDVTKNGKFHSLFIRDGEVFTTELASRTFELMGLDKGEGAILEFGEAKAKQDNTVELSQLKLGHRNEDKKFPDITVSVDIIRRIGDHRNLSLRLQFVAPDKLPILIPLVLGPALNTKTPVSITAPTKGEIDSLLTGGLLIVDVVASTESPDKTDYRSVSNQMVDYAELLDAGFAEMFRKLNEYAKEEPTPSKR